LDVRVLQSTLLTNQQTQNRYRKPRCKGNPNISLASTNIMIDVIIVDQSDSGDLGDEDSVVSEQLNDSAETRRQGTFNGTAKEQNTAIAAKESRAVRWIRVVAAAVVVLSTLAVALFVFKYMSFTEKKNFTNRFNADSLKILEGIGSTFDRSMGAIDSYAVSLVSSAKQSNQTWPYVTLSDFAVRSSKILRLSKGILFATHVYVDRRQRASWSSYSVTHDSWVEESLDVQEDAWNTTYFGKMGRNVTKSEDIYHTFGEAPENEFYLVQWQTYPVVPSQTGYSVYNFDFWEYPGPSAQAMFDTHQPVISRSYNIPDVNDPRDVYADSYAAYYRDFLPAGRDPYEPLSEIYYVRKTAVDSLRKVDSLITAISNS
jgi:hypothetical protein